MKKLNILKALLDLFFFFSIFSVLGMLVIVPIILMGETDLPINIKGQEFIADDLCSRLLLIPFGISALLFLYAIYLLRTNVKHFVKHRIFEVAVIVNFNRIGICILLSSFLSSTAMFWYNAIRKNNVSIGIDAGGFDSFILSVALGLFFMVLSEVFKIAKGLKEENDLTL